MAEPRPHVVAPDEGWLGGFRHLATGEHTRGAYFALESRGAPGAPMPRPHYHLEADEAEYVATGEREILCGDHVVRAPSGSFVLVPRRAAHQMRDLGAEASRWVHLFSPAGIERWFVERESMRAAGATREELSAAARGHGISDEPPGPPGGPERVVLSDGHPRRRRVLAEGVHTGGRYAAVEVSLEGHGEAGTHAHEATEEAFYVAEGELELTVAERTIRLGPGGFVLVPRGLAHAHPRAVGGLARILVLASPPAARDRRRASARAGSDARRTPAGRPW